MASITHSSGVKPSLPLGPNLHTPQAPAGRTFPSSHGVTHPATSPVLPACLALHSGARCLSSRAPPTRQISAALHRHLAAPNSSTHLGLLPSPPCSPGLPPLQGTLGGAVIHHSTHCAPLLDRDFPKGRDVVLFILLYLSTQGKHNTLCLEERLE